MPIYEYSCEKCGDVVERIQKFSDPILTEHEECGGSLTKLISQSSFHLKGDGWYVTDYARKDKEDANGDKKESKKPADAESEGTKETGTSDKPAKSDKAEKTETSSKTTKKESSTSKSDKSKPSGGSG